MAATSSARKTSRIPEEPRVRETARAFLKPKRRWIRWVLRGMLVAGGLFILLLLMINRMGLPAAVGDAIRSELAARGISVQFEKLYLDLRTRVVAQKLQVSQEKGVVDAKLEIDELRFSFNWLSWWRGEPFLDGAWMQGGDLVLPLDQETSIRLHDVVARVDLGPDTLFIRESEAKILNFILRAHGSVNLKNFKPQPGAKPMDLALFAKPWAQAEGSLRQLQGRRPIELDAEFHFDWAEPLKGEYNLFVRADRQTWRGLVVEETDIRLAFQDERLNLDGNIALQKGGLRFDSVWKNGDRSARLQFQADAEPLSFAPLVPGDGVKALAALSFTQAPACEGYVDLNWDGPFSFFTQARVHWQNFKLGEHAFDRLYVAGSSDGKRFILTELGLEDGQGKLEANAYYDGDKTFKGFLKTTLDPTVFKPALGEGAQPFLNSLVFHGKGPVLEAELSGVRPVPEAVLVAGSAAVGAMSYKGVEIEEAKSAFSYKNGELTVRDGFLRRKEGVAKANAVHNFKTKFLRIESAETQVEPIPLATIFSSKLVEYLSPYTFSGVPKLVLSGDMDLDTQQKTNLSVQVAGLKGLDFTLFGKKLHWQDVDASMKLVGQQLELKTTRPAKNFEGTIDAELRITLDQKQAYRAKLKTEDQDFGTAMNTFFGNREVTGEVSADMTLEGQLGKLETVNGWGEAVVKEGVLYDIPMFGGFSDILNSIVPNLGYAKAGQARTTFVIRDGVISADKIDIHSATFALIGNGTYDMVNDKVDLSMRVNIRGPMGIVLFGVSKLFEYRGTGTMADTKWEPKAF
jgi:hypothetical protein